MVNKGNFTFQLLSNDQEWQFHIATDIDWSRTGNLTLLLISIGPEWKFHIATDI